MSNPIERLRSWLGALSHRKDEFEVLLSAKNVTMGDLREILRLAELGQKVRELEREPKDDPETLKAESDFQRGRAEAALEALRLIVGVKP